MPSDVIEAANGRWPEILSTLAGLTPTQLSNVHQPCPACGGDDRYRFDDKDGRGTWFCSHCGGRNRTGGGGTGITLLMAVRNWDFKQAAQAIESHLGIPRSTVRRPAPADAANHLRFRPLPQHTPTIAVLEEPITVTSPYLYTPLQSTARITRADGKKRFEVQHRIATSEPWNRGAGPNPWPILNQSAILDACSSGWPVEIEGEKCAGIATAIGAAFFTHPGHAHKLAQIRERYALLRQAGCPGIILVADSGDADRNKAGKPITPEGIRRAHISIQAAFLENLPILWIQAADAWPELHGIPGASLDDVPGDPADAILRLESAIQAKHQALLQADNDDAFDFSAGEPPPATISVDHAGAFAFLGYDGDGFYYLPSRSGQVVRLARSAHTGTNLVALAPIAHWEASFPGGNGGVNWSAAASDLFERQYQVGMFDPACLRGRGAWLDQGQVVVHFGDRLRIDGHHSDITTKPPGSPYHYQRSQRLAGPGDVQPLTDQEGFELLSIAERFSWEHDFHGRLMMGWVVLAPICGVLPWRPHTWVTASPGSGKSTMLRDFVVPLLVDLGQQYAGTSTEPGIRQDLKCDALPVLMDEAESNTHADALRISAILSLARNSSSDFLGATVKGSVGNTSDGPARYRMRSMFMLSSVATNLRQFADARRFTLLSLRPPHEIPHAERDAHWRELQADLSKHVSIEIGQRLLARTMANIPAIREAVRLFVPAAATFFKSQLQGDQLGTLLAGAWCLCHSGVPTADDIKQELSLCNWAPQQESTETPDERNCLNTILQLKVLAEGGGSNHTRTILELAQIAAGRSSPMESVDPSEASDVLGRHGLRWDPDGLAVSNVSKQLEYALRDTAWSSNWPAQLRRIPGAERTRPIYFKGIGTHRAVRIPVGSLDPESAASNASNASNA